MNVKTSFFLVWMVLIKRTAELWRSKQNLVSRCFYSNLWVLLFSVVHHLLHWTFYPNNILFYVLFFVLPELLDPSNVSELVLVLLPTYTCLLFLHLCWLTWCSNSAGTLRGNWWVIGVSMPTVTQPWGSHWGPKRVGLFLFLQQWAINSSTSAERCF